MALADGVAIAVAAMLHRTAAVLSLLFGPWLPRDGALGWRWAAVIGAVRGQRHRERRYSESA